MTIASTPPIVRLLSRVVITPGNCWEWQGSRRGHMGYSQIGANGRVMYGHIVSYEHFHGPKPEGTIIRHTCDNPICVQPDHLTIGTHKDNHADMDSRGRRKPAKGESQHLAKLTAEAVRHIRSSDETANELAARYGVSHWTIRDVLKGKTWRHI